MSTATLAAPAAAPPVFKPAATTYQPRLITKDEYYRLGEADIFGQDRTELIGGVVWLMPIPGNLHGLGISLVAEAAQAAFGHNFWVRTQLTLDLSPVSVPIPDVAVVAGNMRSFIGQKANPATALLVVEVSDSTLREDQTWKANMYAAAGITDYWILNISDLVLEIRRSPRPDPAEPFGHSYASLATLSPGDFASPLAAPDARIPVADLMPA